MLHIKVVPDTDEGCSVMKKTVFLQVFASVPKELLLDGGFEQLSANNVIAETQVDRDGDSRTTTFTYTYFTSGN